MTEIFIFHTLHLLILVVHSTHMAAAYRPLASHCLRQAKLVTNQIHLFSVIESNGQLDIMRVAPIKVPEILK